MQTGNRFANAYILKDLIRFKHCIFASQNEYATRSKVNITVSSPNLKANDTANLSMAVYRLDSIQSIDENTIDNYLLLSSGLKGDIQDPSYYFNETK